MVCIERVWKHVRHANERYVFVERKQVIKIEKIEKIELYYL